MNIDREEMGRRIKEALDKAGVQQRELAETLGVSPSSVTNYIQGRNEPSAQGLATIAEICGVTIDWLVTGGDYRNTESPEKEHPPSKDTGGVNKTAIMREALRMMDMLERMNPDERKLIREIVEEQS